MVNIDSPARLSDIKQQIILTQTDTTVGFVSQSATRLAEIKSRSSNKPFIKVYTSFKALKKSAIRIPNKQKKAVRRSQKSSFIINNTSFRVAAFPLHSAILRALAWSYSTSANESGKNYSRRFCEAKADIIVEDKKGLHEKSASKLYKINNVKKVRLR
jgi:tRNA A37 threonylcarbamoyladenosine synthetase subunit TsaC/SUA5/YrdC